MDEKNTNIETKKSTVKPEGGTFSSTDISSGNNSYPKTSTRIEYENDESVDIKQEIMEDQETSSKEVTGQTGKLNSNWKKKSIMSTGEYESHFFKHPSEQHRMLLKNNETDFTCEIEESNDQTLEIKEEIIEIEYIIDEALEIKEEIMEDQENTSQKRSQKHESKWYTVNIKGTDNFTFDEKLLTYNKKKIQESKQGLENKHKCEKCARSYKYRQDLDRHKKFECGVMPQFKCKFCEKRFKQNSALTTHILGVHQKAKKSALIYKCDKCPRSYTWLNALYRHKQAEHAAVKPEFICAYCGHKTNQKYSLASHIYSRHSK
ncbi:zinc finger protein 493-like [Belonocnema kinseyi]|uniref:zinc finger protein 493-like n=1 Tax=Belonocnema kinseyi TaxID=2817044 RepID=UPI00143DA002|nr:zinc finger protein 493-like [Belonocnema kinseyi]